ncbi:MAG TPA: hypothetical protein VF170_16255, partial [Planctomycetaceae bacterium]
GFGDFNGDGQIDTLPGNPIARYTFGIGSVAAAEDFVTLPDSFVTLADRLAGTFTYNASGPAITLLPTGSNALREYAGQTVRVTALHVDNPESVVRDGMVDAAGNGVTLASPLPAAYTNGTIGRLLIEVPERRFTWMATVRRFGVKPSVTIVVFFRRAFDPADERVYFCGEPAGSYNEFTLVPGQNGGSTPPGLKVGGWMFDLYTFRWWKIASVREANVPLAGGGTAPGLRFTVDPEEVDPSAEARGVGMPRGPVYAIFPRNVVEAYTLKKD